MPLLFKCLIWGYVLFDICSNTVCFNLFQKIERTYLRHEMGLKSPIKTSILSLVSILTLSVFMQPLYIRFELTTSSVCCLPFNNASMRLPLLTLH